MALSKERIALEIKEMGPATRDWVFREISVLAVPSDTGPCAICEHSYSDHFVHLTGDDRGCTPEDQDVEGGEYECHCLGYAGR